MSSTIKVDNIKNLAGDDSGIDLSTNDQIILKTANTTAITINSSQNTTLAGNLVIPDAGNIGSASDTDAMSISSGGVVNFTQSPTGTALVKLLEDDISTSDGTYVVNNTYINSSYDSYLIQYEVQTCTTDDVQMQVKYYVTTTASGDAGSLLTGANYSYGTTRLGADSSTSAHRSLNTASSGYGVIGYTEIGNSTGEGMQFTGTLQNVNSTNNVASFHGTGTLVKDNGNHHGFDFWVGIGTPATYGAYYVRGMLFQLSGGQHTGKFRLYGFN